MRKCFLIGMVGFLFSCGGDYLDDDNAKSQAYALSGGHIDLAGLAENQGTIYEQTHEEALAQDLQLVAKAKGWTIAEAAADRKAADAIGQVAERLAAERPDIFVGSALADGPGGTPTLYVKGPAGKFVFDLVADSGIEIHVADGQPFSFAELEERKLRVHRALADLGYKDIVTSFDLGSAGLIRAAVSKQPKLAARAAEIAMALPAELREDVELSVSDTPVAWDQHAFGGMRVLDDGVPECTSGWSVAQIGTGVTGVTTAGHCTGINQIEHGSTVHALVHRGEHRGVWGDVEWKTSTTSEPARFYATARSIRDTESLEPRAGISVGESICFYGRFSNSRNCTLDVNAVSVSCTVSGVFNDRLVRMNGNVAIPGDSGGGWSWNTRAYGSLKGVCGGGNVFSVADLYDEALGVRVRTASSCSGVCTPGDIRPCCLVPGCGGCCEPGFRRCTADCVWGRCGA